MGGIAPVAGIIFGLGFIALSIAQKGAGINQFTDLASWVIVLGGAFSATLISFDPRHLLTSFRSLASVFRPKSYPYPDVSAKIYRIAAASRRNAAAGIENEAEDIEDEFFKLAVDKAIATVDQDQLRDLLDIQMRALRKEHRDNQEVFKRMGAYAPAFGMVGTLIGLIVMLGSVESGDVSAIASAMATALVTTFIGLIAANLLFLPVATKIGEQSEREAAFYEYIVEGVLAATAGLQPNRVFDRIQAFVPPSELKNVDSAVAQARETMRG